MEKEEKTKETEGVNIEKVIAELTAKHLKEINALKAEHTEEVRVLVDDVEELKERLAEIEKDPDELNRVKGTFKVASKTYQFKKGYKKINHEGEILEVADVLKNKALLKELVEMDFGGLEEIEE